MTTQREAPRGVRDVPVASADPVVRAGSEILGGALGRYAKVGRALPWRAASTALTLVATVTMALGTYQKGYCFANGWTVPDAFWRACYSDLPFLYSSSVLAQGRLPYGDAGVGALGEPIGTGVVMWLVSLLVPSGDAALRQRWYVVLWAGLLMILLAALVRATAQSCRRDPWRALHVAAAPVVCLAALVSADLVGVTLASYGLLAWGRNRRLEAGVWLGLAAACRTYPLLFLIVLGALAVRSGRVRQWAETAGVALLTFGGVLVATGLLTHGASVRPYLDWRGAGTGFGSIWYVPTAIGSPIRADIAAALAVTGWLVAASAGALLALSARRRPTVAEIALVVVGIVLLTGKNLPVQSSLWLVPLVALAGLRWRDHLVWAACEAMYFVTLWIHLGGLKGGAENRGLPLPWLAVFTLVRLAGIFWLVVVTWRQASARPAALDEEDLTGDPDDLRLDPAAEPDPLAGPMTGRGDRTVVTFA